MWFTHSFILSTNIQPYSAASALADTENTVMKNTDVGPSLMEHTIYHRKQTLNK